MNNSWRTLWALSLVALAGACEYVGGIGLFAAEYREEQREERRRLEECGTCAAGERCNLLMDPGQCRPEGGSPGDPCGAWRGRSDEKYQFGCEPPLVCNEALEPDACTLPGTVGTACHHAGHCAADAWCREWTCTPTLPLGSACDDDDACRPNVCLDATRTCEVPRGLGEACMSGLDCGLGLGCSEAGRCIDPLPDQPKQ
jgi:hypothetical protein